MKCRCCELQRWVWAQPVCVCSILGAICFSPEQQLQGSWLWCFPEELTVFVEQECVFLHSAGPGLGLEKAGMRWCWAGFQPSSRFVLPSRVQLLQGCSSSSFSAGWAAEEIPALSRSKTCPNDEQQMGLRGAPVLPVHLLCLVAVWFNTHTQIFIGLYSLASSYSDFSTKLQLSRKKPN